MQLSIVYVTLVAYLVAASPASTEIPADALATSHTPASTTPPTDSTPTPSTGTATKTPAPTTTETPKEFADRCWGTAKVGFVDCDDRYKDNIAKGNAKFAFDDATNCVEEVLTGARDCMAKDPVPSPSPVKSS